MEARRDEKKAWVDVETPEGSKILRTDYVVGCDGAHGQPRKSMGCDFLGFIWEDQIVATNVGPLEVWKFEKSLTVLRRRTLTL